MDRINKEVKELENQKQMACRGVAADLSITITAPMKSYVKEPISIQTMGDAPHDEEIATIRQELLRKEHQKMALLPLQQALRSKSTIKCHGCGSLLVSPQIQPLIGDSCL